MKKIIIYLLVLSVFVGGKAYDTNTRNKAKNEALKEIEQEKEIEEPEAHFYYDEFNEQYIIDINGNAYTFQEIDIDFINEYEDLEEIKPGIREVVEDGENFKN